MVNKKLTPQEQLSKDKLQEFIKDHPILKCQERFARMEKALKFIAAQHNKGKAGNWAVEVAREALKED